jgi:hypothetical protein
MVKAGFVHVPNLKSVNNKPIFKKTASGKYYQQTGNKLGALSKQEYVKKNGVQMKIANLNKVPAATEFTKTNYKYLNKNVYVKNSVGTHYYLNASGKFVSLTKSKSVTKNGVTKKLSNFVGAKKKPVASVSLVTLIPIIKPSADHIKSKETIYAEKVQKVAEKLEEIKSIEGKTKNTNFTNFMAKRGEAPIAYAQRTNTMNYYYTTIQGFNVLTSGNWINSLSVPHFQYVSRSVSIHYTEYILQQQLLFRYGRNINSMNNMRISDIIDKDWMVAQDHYIRTLAPRQLFTIYGYSLHGDKIAHSYLDGRFVMSKFKVSNSNAYFPFFFQAREFYKIDSGYVRNDYNVVISRLQSEESKSVIESIIKMFINELNEIIRKSPSVTRTFITFRGNKDDMYLTGSVDNTYTTERFCSSSVIGDIGYKFSEGHVLQRITILKGSKCLLMFGITKFAEELEVLLPRGSTYRIVKKRTSVKNTKNIDPLKPTYIYNNVTRLEDVILFGSPEMAEGNSEVSVQVNVNTNTKLMQKFFPVGRLIASGKNSKVFSSINNKTAIKIQKRTNNSTAEVKAMNKLHNTGIAPRLKMYTDFNVTNNLKKLLPNLKVGNKVAITGSNLIKGRPLGNWYKTPVVPLPQNLKNKIKNAVQKMHNKGVIHGNLRRNKVIVGNNGKVHIVGFKKSIVTNKKINNANNYVKKLTGKSKKISHKNAWYSGPNRYHFLNGNFLKSLV